MLLLGMTLGFLFFVEFGERLHERAKRVPDVEEPEQHGSLAFSGVVVVRAVGSSSRTVSAA